MLALILSNVFTTTNPYTHRLIIDSKECIYADLDLNDKQLLTQLRNNYENIKCFNERYDVNSMQELIEENENDNVLENIVNLKKTIDEQAKTFEKITKIVKSEKVRNYIAFVQVLGKCAFHLNCFDINLYVNNRFVITNDLERKLIREYVNSSVYGKEKDTKVQYFLRLAKYFVKEFETNHLYFDETREFIKLADLFANYQRTIEKLLELIKTLVK